MRRRYIPGNGEGQGSLACCSPWGRKELDTTEQLKNNDNRELMRDQCHWDFATPVAF